jgi:hypothetical protein
MAVRRERHRAQCSFYDVFFNQAGLSRIVVHLNYDAWISVSGKAIVERDTWTNLINERGVRSVG